eukprot:IDg6326t1
MLSLAHLAVTWSNLAALLLFRRAVALQYNLLAILTLLSFASSTFFHATHNDLGVRDALPPSLVLDRIFAVCLACRVLTLPETGANYLIAIKAALPVAIPAAVA